jgi:hypothetical protein
MKHKLPIIKIQQNNRSITLTMLAFFPNRLGGKNSGYVVALNTDDIQKKPQSIHPDETGKFLYINEMLLPISRRVALHRESRLMNDKPLIYDERAKTARFVW